MRPNVLHAPAKLDLFQLAKPESKYINISQLNEQKSLNSN